MAAARDTHLDFISTIGAVRLHFNVVKFGEAAARFTILSEPIRVMFPNYPGTAYAADFGNHRRLLTREVFLQPTVSRYHE
jgi:hypothetical protein